MILLFVLGILALAQDYYKILGINKNASAKEIKSAYRKKAKEYHPDTNDAEDANERFTEVSEAYDVLGDEELRKIYNNGGAGAVEKHRQGNNGRGGDPFGGADPFSFFFGGGNAQRVKTTEPLFIYIPVSLGQFYNGDAFDVTFQKTVLCPNYEDCLIQADHCVGPGVKVVRQHLGGGMYQQTQSRDETCVASKKSINKKCRSCKDGLTELEIGQVDVTVPPGSGPVNKFTFNGQGNTALGAETGNVVVIAQETPHPIYVRGTASPHNLTARDLYCEVRLKLSDSIEGVDMKLPHPNGLEGETIRVKISSPVGHNHLHKMDGKGLPQRGAKGSLYILFKLEFPVEMDPADQKIVSEILRKTKKWNKSN